MVLALPKKRRRYIVSDPEQRGMYWCVRRRPARTSHDRRGCDLYKQAVGTRSGAPTRRGSKEARDKARAAIARIKAGLPAVESPPRQAGTRSKASAEDWLKRDVAKGKLRTQPED